MSCSSTKTAAPLPSREQAITTRQQEITNQTETRFRANNEEHRNNFSEMPSEEVAEEVEIIPSSSSRTNDIITKVVDAIPKVTIDIKKTSSAHTTENKTITESGDKVSVLDNNKNSTDNHTPNRGGTTGKTTYRLKKTYYYTEPSKTKKRATNLHQRKKKKVNNQAKRPQPRRKVVGSVSRPRVIKKSNTSKRPSTTKSTKKKSTKSLGSITVFVKRSNYNQVLWLYNSKGFNRKITIKKQHSSGTFLKVPLGMYVVKREYISKRRLSGHGAKKSILVNSRKNTKISF